MSITGYTLTKLANILSAQDREAQLERSRAQRQAAQNEAIARLVGQIPQSAIDVAEFGQGLAAADIDRRTKAALASAEAGEFAKETPAGTVAGGVAPISPLIKPTAEARAGNMVDEQQAREYLKTNMGMSDADIDNFLAMQSGQPPETPPMQPALTKEQVFGGINTGSAAESPSTLNNLTGKPGGIFGLPLPEEQPPPPFVAPPAAPQPQVRTKTVGTVSGQIMPGIVTGSIIPGSTKLVEETTPPSGKEAGVVASPEELQRMGLRKPAIMSLLGGQTLKTPDIEQYLMEMPSVPTPTSPTTGFAPIPSPAGGLTSEQIRAQLSGGKGGPKSNVGVNDIIEGETEAAYRKRLQEGGLKPAEVEKRVKERYVAGKRDKSGKLRLELTEEDMQEPIQVRSMTQAAPSTERDTVQTVAAAQQVGIEPSAAELLEQPAVQEVDPLEEAQKEYFKKLQSYKQPTFAEPDEKVAAKKVVEEIFAQKPEGNPILNILSLGMYQNRFNEAKSLAEKLVAKEIRNERKVTLENHRKQFFEQAKVEAQALAMQQKARMDQARLNQMQAKALKLNVQNPAKVVENLGQYKVAQQGISDVISAGKNIISKKQEFPMGQAKALKEVAFNVFLGAPLPSQSAAVALGAMGVGGSASLATGERKYDSELFKEAADKLLKSKMTPEQTAFVSRLTLAIQQLGKAREGGRMTDADLRFYMNNLAAMDSSPQALLDSINYLSMVNARTHNLWASEYNKLPGMPQFGLIEPTQFGTEDFSNARMMSEVPMPEVPGPLANPVASGVGGAAATIGRRIESGTTGTPADDASGY